jgi:acyl-CoA synthetase (AMP-forming)/AMP-acid ligase II
MPTAGEIIERNARCFPQRQAVICGERRLTHAELALRARQLAAAWHAQGLRRGERISILAMNGIEYLEVYAAVEWSGLVLNTLNWRLAPAELEWIVADVCPTVLVFELQYAALVDGMRARLGSVQRGSASATPSIARRGPSLTRPCAREVTRRDAATRCPRRPALHHLHQRHDGPTQGVVQGNRAQRPLPKSSRVSSGWAATTGCSPSHPCSISARAASLRARIGAAARSCCTAASTRRKSSAPSSASASPPFTWCRPWSRRSSTRPTSATTTCRACAC